MWSARGSICGCQPRAEEGGSVLDSHVSLCLCDCEDRNGASCRRQLLAAFGWGQRVLSVRNVQGGGEALNCFRARYLQRRGGRGRRVLADGGVNPPKPGPMCGNPARSDACGGRGRDPLQEHIGTAKGGRTPPKHNSTACAVFTVLVLCNSLLLSGSGGHRDACLRCRRVCIWGRKVGICHCSAVASAELRAPVQ